MTISDPFKSAHARYAAYAAERCGFSFRSLDGTDGYLFEVTDGARTATFAAGAGSPYGLNDTRAASIARDKAFCADVLRLANVPVVDGEKFFVTSRWREMRHPGREAADAIAYVRASLLPVFCKPISASNGIFAELIDSAEAFEDYLERVSREHFAILIQPYISAAEYRVFVLEGRALFSYRKTPPGIFGDGVRTLSALINATPRDDNMPAASQAARSVEGATLALDAVLPAGKMAWLVGPANRSAGGGADELREGARADLERTALAASNAVGLRLAAVDMFDCDAGPVVIEVNSNPMIATLEDHGRWDLIETIWRANFDVALR